MKSKRSFGGMFKNIFRRNAVVFIIFQLIALLKAVTSIIHFSNVQQLPKDDIYISEYSLYSAADNALLMFLLFVESIILAFILFRELFGRRSVDFLFSAPVKRTEYFGSAVLFGLLNILSVCFIICAITVGAVKLNIIDADRIVFDTGLFFKQLSVVCLSSCEIFALFGLCAAVSGRVWHYLIFCFIGTVAVYFTAGGMIQYINSIWGLWIDYSNVRLVSPIGAAVPESTKETVWLCAIILFRTAVIYTAGRLAFKKRKAETAETSVSGTAVPTGMTVIILLLLAFCYFSYNRISFYTCTFAVLSIAAAAAVFSAVFYRKAFTRFAAVCFGITVLITAVFIACVELIPQKSYVKYVPELSEIETVTIESGGDYMTDYLFFDDYFNGDEAYIYAFTEEHSKEKCLLLHKKIVTEEAIENRFSDTYYQNGQHSVKIEYLLKNGKKISRSYTAAADDIFSEYMCLMKTDEALAQTVPFSCRTDEIVLTCAEVYTDDFYSEGSAEQYLYIPAEEYEVVLNCLKEDLKSLSDQEFSLHTDTGALDLYIPEKETADVVLGITFFKFGDSATEAQKAHFLKLSSEERMEFIESIRFSDIVSEENAGIISVYCQVTTDFKNTIKYFEDNGYL